MIKSRIKVSGLSLTVNDVPVLQIESKSITSKEISERARDLVGTSVDDLQSGLWAYSTREDLRVLRAGLKIVKRRKETTKAKILERRIKKVESGLGVKL